MLPQLSRSVRVRLPNFAVRSITTFNFSSKNSEAGSYNNAQRLSNRFYCACRNLPSTSILMAERNAGVRNVYPQRCKSTNPERKKDAESMEAEAESLKDDAHVGVGHEMVASEQKTEEIERTSKRRDTSVIPKTTEDEEKSRRRYEKEDPPEEERHKYHKQRPERAINKALMRTDYFDNMKDKNKENFVMALELFEERDIHLRGHVEFIYVALRSMKQFGVHKDLEAYKRIIDVFPKGRMIQTNMFQAEFLHFPKQQQCAIDILEQMEDNSVIPDSGTQELLTNIFGNWSFPMRKASRMLYWMPKFKNLSPWSLPDKLPDNALELAKLAVARMTSVDVTTKITIYDCAELEDAYDLTWIVSGQSPEQQKLIESHPSDRPIYVEGAFRVWLRDVCMNYFILRTEPKPVPKYEKTDPDDVGKLHTIFEEEFIDKSLQLPPSVHEQEDGVILGICCTGSSSRDSVVSWIRFLEETNPRLGKDISVLFTLKSPIGPTDDVEILTYQDLEELQKLGKSKDPFTSPIDKLGLDPGMPDLRQVGVWTDSDTKFPNWPHNFHSQDSISFKNKLENERFLREIETRGRKEPDEIGTDVNVDQKSKEKPEKTKQIE